MAGRYEQAFYDKEINGENPYIVNVICKKFLAE
jgi:hypothetical protein